MSIFGGEKINVMDGSHRQIVWVTGLLVTGVVGFVLATSGCQTVQNKGDNKTLQKAIDACSKTNGTPIIEQTNATVGIAFRFKECQH